MENFTMQEIMNITGQNALTVKGIGEQLGIVAERVNMISRDINTLKVDMDELKLNEEVTTTQQEVIIEMGRKRILEILGTNPLDVQKYFKIFIQKLYSETRKKAGLGSKISRTKKCDYQRVLDYMEAWNPSCGVYVLKTKADSNAIARKIAREDGYM